MSSRDWRLMPKELKVYVLECDDDFDFRYYEHRADYEPIMARAEEKGTVYSLQGFQDAINDEDLFLDNAFILIN